MKIFPDSVSLQDPIIAQTLPTNPLLTHEGFLDAVSRSDTDPEALATAFAVLAQTDKPLQHNRTRARRRPTPERQDLQHDRVRVRRRALLERQDLKSGDLVVVLGHRTTWLENDELSLALSHPAWDAQATVVFLDQVQFGLGLASTTRRLIDELAHFGDPTMLLAQAVHPAVAREFGRVKSHDRIARTLDLVERLLPFGTEALPIFEGLLEDWSGTAEDCVTATVAVLTPTTPAPGS